MLGAADCSESESMPLSNMQMKTVIVLFSMLRLRGTPLKLPSMAELLEGEDLSNLARDTLGLDESQSSYWDEPHVFELHLETEVELPRNRK